MQPPSVYINLTLGRNIVYVRHLLIVLAEVLVCGCSTGRDQAGVLRIPEEVSQLTLLETLSIDFAGAPANPQDFLCCPRVALETLSSMLSYI